MKPSSNNSKLDIFIRESLKNFDANHPSSDWNELEMQLGAERKPISIGISKKTIFISAAVLVVATGVFALIKYIGSFQEFRNEGTTATDTIITIQPVNNSQTTTVATPSISATDTIRPKDTIASTEKILKKDSVAVKKNETQTAETNTSSSDEAKTSAVKENKKKTKLSSLAPSIKDTGNILENILPPDTSNVSHPPVVPNKDDIKKTADTVKNSSPPTKNKNKKKQKSTSADSAPQVKPDSLKQQ